MRCPLGNDQHGNPIELPSEAVSWRVRIGGGRRGRPRLVFDPDTGRQLEVPLASTLDDLRDTGLAPGRYRLEAVDRAGAVIPGVVALTELVYDDDEEPGAKSIDLDHLTRLLQTVERQTDTLCRALEAMANAFGPVRPPRVAMVEDAGPMENPISPELMQGIAGAVKSVADVFGKGGGSE